MDEDAHYNEDEENEEDEVTKEEPWVYIYEEIYLML